MTDMLQKQVVFRLGNIRYNVTGVRRQRGRDDLANTTWLRNREYKLSEVTHGGALVTRAGVIPYTQLRSMECATVITKQYKHICSCHRATHISR